MLSLKKLSLVVFSLSAISTFSVYGDEPVCHRCEEIREYNAEHHHNFEYYDEYLKTEGKSQEATNNPTINKPIDVPSAAPKPKAPVAERNVVKPASSVNNATKSTNASGVKTIPSATTSTPSTGVSAPNAAPATQAPQNGTVPQKSNISR